jgi:hypothetical protein
MRNTFILNAIFIAVLTAAFGNTSIVIAQDISPAPASIAAAKRGGPFISFTDGQYLPADTRNLAARGVDAPVAQASADFDADGTADLAVAYRTANGGLVTIRRGNVESVFPLHQDIPPAPFFNGGTAFELPFAPDFLAAGDFNADGKPDLLAAKRGTNSLVLLPGDGAVNFDAPRTMQLTGTITAFAAGEMNNFDNLPDVAVGITEKNRSKILIFQSHRGAFASEPEIVKVRNVVSAMAFGQLDGKGPRDLAAAAGDELIIVGGGVKSEEKAVEIAAQRITRYTIDFRVSALAIGDFTGGSENEIAALSGEGALRVSGADFGRGFTQVGTPLAGPGTNSILFAAKVSTGIKADLVIGGNSQIHIARADGSGHLSLAASFDAVDAPVAVLPMRLNKDALADLVVLHANGVEPSVLMTAPVSVITVNSTSPTRTTGAINLEDAIRAANLSPGLDEIRFNIADPGTPILVESDLPEITEGVTFDATTQTGFNGEPIIVIKDSAGAVFTVPMLRFVGGNSVLRAFVVTTNSSLLNILELSGNNNFIEGNFIGTNRQGTASGGDGLNGVSVSSSGNTIGGGVPQARNVISGVAGAPSSEGVSITGNNNRIEGNYVGTDKTGLQAVPNSGVGVWVGSIGTGNVVGGPAAGQRNLISGNGLSGLTVNPTPGDFSDAVIENNFIGTDVNGAAALGNGQHGVKLAFSAGNNFPAATVGVFDNLISGNTGDGIYANNIAVPGELNVSPEVLNSFLWVGSRSQGSLAASPETLPAGNRIGTNAAGTAALPNTGNGIRLENFPSRIEGGTISANGANGIRLTGSAPFGNLIADNFIGTNSSGTAAIGNGNNGISVESASFPTDETQTTKIYDNVISGNLACGAIGGIAAARNTEAAPELAALFLVDMARRPNGGLHGAANGVASPGNRIGTNAAGTAALPNLGDGVKLQNAAAKIEGNVISGNGENGIKSLSQPGVASEITDNHIGVDASGANSLGNGVDGVNIELNGAAPAEIEASKVWDNVISGNGGDGVSVSGENVTWGSFRSASPEAGAAFFVDIAARRSGTASPEAGVLFFVDIAARRSGTVSPGTAPTGNRIGTNAAGTAVLPNGGNGIKLIAAPAQIENNLISGNATNGISSKWLPANFPAAFETRISNNYIGTDISGNNDLGNGASGITVERGAITPNSPKTFITASVISGNTGNGIEFVQTGAARPGEAAMPLDGIADKPSGCYIGTNAAGTAPLANGGNGISIRSPGVAVGGATAPERNIISGNSGSGIKIEPVDAGTTLENIEIENNFIGINAAGSAVIPNSEHGLFMTYTGGLVKKNLISGNGMSGISAKPPITTSLLFEISENYIGTDVAGNIDLGNAGDGITLEYNGTVPTGVRTSDILGNVVSGNNGDGVRIFGNVTFDSAGTRSGSNNAMTSPINWVPFMSRPTGSQGQQAAPGNLPLGNRIGTNAAGTAALGNSGHGVSITGVPTKIGGDTADDGNIIAHNGGSGVNIANIGDQTGRPGSPVLNNFIYSNTLLAIDLGGDGPTPNDLLDPDMGPNNLQNYPVLASAFSHGPSTTINGVINTTPNTYLKIHFYKSLGGLLGKDGPMGMLLVSSNASGNATFSATFPVAVTAGSRVVAVATTADTNPGNENNTSEVSPGITVFAPTSASVTVTGRILSPQGAVSQAVVSLADQNGVTRTAISNGFGYYRFENVTVGQSYMFNVRSKRYQFAPRIVTVLEEMEDLNFTAQ